MKRETNIRIGERTDRNEKKADGMMKVEAETKGRIDERTD